MSKVGIVTDSTSCLPPELIQKYDIQVGSVNLILDGQVFRDQAEISPAEFWSLFKDLRELPTTSAVNPGDFKDIFTKLGKSTDSIAVIILSKALSATYPAAVEARDIVRSERPGLNIEIIDTQTVAGALGFIVLEAARAAQTGKSLAEVIQVAQNMIPRVKFFAGLDTLKYLIKGGRAPKTAYIGELLQVKPIIGMTNNSGVIESLGSVRGKRKCWLKMADMINKHIDTNKPIHLMIHYSDNIEDGKEVKNIVTSRYNCVEVYLTPFTPVMATHTGPVLSLSFYS